jgi:hypothetical protein
LCQSGGKYFQKVASNLAEYLLRICRSFTINFAAEFAAHFDASVAGQYIDLFAAFVTACLLGVLMWTLT